MERRYAQDMVSRLFFISFYTHGRYKTKKKEGIFWSILSSMYNFTVTDNLISDVLNLSYPQKQKILPPLYNFENILLHFSEVIKVKTSMFWKTQRNWRKGEKYEAIYMWSASTLDAPFSRWKSRFHPICIHITYQSNICERI